MSSDWRFTTVGDFCPFVYGKALPERNRTPGPFPVISSAGISGSHNLALVPTGGIVIGRKGTVGSVTLSKTAFWPIDTVFYIQDEPQRDLRYTYYLLKTLGLEHMNSDSAVPGLNRDSAHALSIFVSSLQEQRAIGHILGTLDDNIELKLSQNQTLEEMASTIFKAWFVDFEPVRAKIEGRWQRGQSLPGLPAHLYDIFPDQFVESELGEIPKKWHVSKVESLLTRLSAKNRYTKKQVLEFGQVPVFEQGASIIMGYHNGVGSYQASSENPIFIFGDHTCITRLSCQPFDISQNLIPIKGKDRATAWVYYAIKEKQKFQEYRRHWMELVSKDVVIATPDICLAYASKITPIHLQLEANERQIQVLKELRNALLPKLISGELRVHIQHNKCSVE